MFGWIRVISALLLAAVVTPALALAQVFVLRTGFGDERALPQLWHRFVLWILGFRLHVYGAMSSQRPLMLAGNHISWTDIMVVGAAAQVNFVAKSEVSGWPAIGVLSKLQRTVYVERDKKRRSGEQAGEIAQRLKRGDPMMLFAEGVTADGNSLLPFKTTLFGAASLAVDEGVTEEVAIQPVAVAYTRLQGMPMGRQHRPHACWIGDRLLLPHIVSLLREGAVDVELHFGEPVVYRRGASRKAVAQEVERRVNAMFSAALRNPAAGRGTDARPAPQNAASKGAAAGL